MIINKHYKINRNTMALLYDPGITYRTIILEPNKIIYCTKTSRQLIEEACIAGGATYRGRKKAMEQMLHTKSKLPIPVNPNEGLIFLPNISPNELHCNWFSFYHIQDFQKCKNDITKTKIMFTDGRSKMINTPYSSMNRQIILAGFLIAQTYKDNIWH